jgi:hypothetical protein
VERPAAGKPTEITNSGKAIGLLEIYKTKPFAGRRVGLRILHRCDRPGPIVQSAITMGGRES